VTFCVRSQTARNTALFTAYSKHVSLETHALHFLLHCTLSLQRSQYSQHVFFPLRDISLFQNRLLWSSTPGGSTKTQPHSNRSPEDKFRCCAIGDTQNHLICVPAAFGKLPPTRPCL
jgi:hypothetical protein